MLIFGMGEIYTHKEERKQKLSHIFQEEKLIHIYEEANQES